MGGRGGAAAAVLAGVVVVLVGGRSVDTAAVPSSPRSFSYIPSLAAPSLGSDQTTLPFLFLRGWGGEVVRW